MTHTQTHTQNLVTLMLHLIDPRTDEEASIDAIAALDLDTAKELLTMVSSWTAGELETRAERLEVTDATLMDLIEKELRETADQMDRLDHDGGLFT